MASGDHRDAGVTAELDITEADVAAPQPAAVAAVDGATPRRIGRYVVLDRVGQGGMGTVVAAYDAELDRTVAIKLLHPRTRVLNAAPRLVREAHALARLSHPNVVAVYDAGTIDGQAFVAMELVRGKTLRQWLRAGRRPWPEVLAKLVEAARGLAAAHAAGIVHRDFKPDNVLIGDADARARVLDFGLALGHGEDSGAIPELGPTSSMLDARLTATGVVLGTPAYMAPEQLRGAPADARSDQYSFCVVLSEALLGERPRFDDEGRGSLPPVRSELLAVDGVPKWLRRVIRRGLAPEPSARWPSMDALVLALVRRTRLGVAALALAMAAVIGALAWPSHAVLDDDTCAREQSIARARWDDATRTRVRTAILDTELGFAGDTWSRLEPRLDGYVDALARLRGEACTSQRDGIDVAGFAGCLDHREAAFAAVVDVLAQTDGESLARASAVVDGLPRLASCSDPTALQDELPMPTEPAARTEVTAIRGALLVVSALRDARRFTDGIERARELLARAQALGYAPVVAEARLALGTLLALAGDNAAAEDELVEAAMVAKAEGLDRVAMLAMTRLTGAVGYQLARVDEGLAWARHAESLVERAHLDLQARALLRNNIGAVEFRAGDYAAAETNYRGTIELVGAPTEPGERQELANAHANLGNVYARQGRFTDASVELERAHVLLTELLGPQHPTVAVTLVNLGNLHYDLGNYPAAAEYLRTAHANVRDALGPEHPLVAASVGNLGLVMHRLGRDHEARRLLEESIALKRRLSGPDHPDVAFAINNLGEVYRDLGQPAEALAQHDAAHAIWQRNDPDHPYAAYPVANRGLDLLELGRVPEALVALREALALCERVQADPPLVGATRFGLAKAILANGGVRTEALAHARAAERTYAGIGGRYERERSRIAAWLAEHENALSVER